MSTEQHLYFLMTRYYSEREDARDTIKDDNRTIEELTTKIKGYEVAARQASCNRDADLRLITKLDKTCKDLRYENNALQARMAKAPELQTTLDCKNKVIEKLEKELRVLRATIGVKD